MIFNLKEEMIALNSELKKASDIYYNSGKEIITNLEFDSEFDKLQKLEELSGYTLPDSVTHSVGARPVPGLKKVTLEYPALSLDKTKEISMILKWIGNKKAVLSWKEDGSTIVATYQDGSLTQLTTRGNGLVGSDITFNADHIEGLPLSIPVKGKVVVRGECVMAEADFMAINASLDDTYQNARNLANATVTATDQSVLQTRPLHIKAFNYVAGETRTNSFSSNLKLLSEYGFDTVEHVVVTAADIEHTMTDYTNNVVSYPYPVDGLVLIYDDVNFGESLGSTGHHAKNGMAFKWQDETAKTTLQEVFWSASRSGRLNPVGVFDPVELCGTTVQRASIHNVSIMKNLNLSIGALVSVMKCNMIIPAIAMCDSDTCTIEIPNTCPICGEKTSIHISGDGTEVLYCENAECPAKRIGAFERFVSRDAMDIDGLSTATLEQFIEAGLLEVLPDLYNLPNHAETIIRMEGMGQKSFDNLVAALERSKKTSFDRVLYGLGIHNVGRAQAKLIGNYLNYNMHEFLWHGSNYDYTEVNGFGPVIQKSILDWLYELRKDSSEKSLFLKLSDMIDSFTIETPVVVDSGISGKIFVITGSVNHFANREEMKAYIEAHGGKTSGSVSSKTDYLINNDTESMSGKNKKAKELGIPVIGEEFFLKLAE